MTKVSRAKVGVCALTGERGRFVRSHILPKALTRPEEPGSQMFQTAGARERPVRRWDSWYDDRLVIARGEQILADLDTWAIQEFQRHQLIWSSWDPRTSVPPPHDDYGPFGLRIFDDIDPGKLRLFFHSILWRAANTNRPEFRAVTLTPEENARLCASLITGIPLDNDFYPVSLTQFSTMGPVHALNVLPVAKKMFDNDGKFMGETPIYRFYFDGLVSHFHVPVEGKSPMKFGAAGVGNEVRFAVQTIPYQGSAHQQQTDALVQTAMVRWPGSFKQ
jgi:hypothetical protein